VGDAAKNVRDTAREDTHKSEAQGERDRRADSGDSMTTGEKAGSVGNEVKNEVQAGVDGAKRDARNA
ncbi:MAG: hypothetical protein M3R35_01575, partial [Candidatus Eremiobacteraeota bacterium]|nr:hypothetical protein [Candidatus Eremiobacteraeota bacterium]